jgi:hypothetical protein
MHPTKFRFIWPTGFRGEDFLEINQSAGLTTHSKNNSFSSETALPNDIKLGWKHRLKVLYRDCSFRFDPLTNMAATGNFCFRLVDF